MIAQAIEVWRIWKGTMRLAA